MLMKSTQYDDFYRRIADLYALIGVPVPDTDLGTFTGDTIPDNVPVKVALQALETKVESLDWIAFPEIT